MATRLAVPSQSQEEYSGDVLESGVSPEFLVAEWSRCEASPHWFVHHHCKVEDVQKAGGEKRGLDVEGGTGTWIPFHLWPAQYAPLRDIHEHNKCLWLKARQLGLTWLGLGYALWTLIFRPGSTVLLFSLRDDEAIELLRRLKGMLARLPAWMIPAGTYDHKGRLLRSNAHMLVLPDGGRAMAFPSNAGDSYTANLAVVDEADLIPKLNGLLASVKPTIDNGGKLLLISRVDKDRPSSAFKNLYVGGRSGGNGFKVCFLPWYAHPARTRRFYDEQRRYSLSATLSLDYLHEQYPATDDEALAARQLDKRFPEPALKEAGVYQPLAPTLPLPAASWQTEQTHAEVERMTPRPGDGLPAGYSLRLEGGPYPERPGKVLVRHHAPCPVIPGLRVYKTPEPAGRYTVGVDLGQGLVASNDSAAVVVDDRTGEEVASFHGKHSPKVTARYAAELSDWYALPANSKCTVMVERNNHGHAFLLWWESNRSAEHYRSRLLKGPDGNHGWNQTASTKETMWHRSSQRITDRRCVVHTRFLYDQILSIEASSLAAPEGFADDIAVAWGLALAGADLKPRPTEWTVQELGRM